MKVTIKEKEYTLFFNCKMAMNMIVRGAKSGDDFAYQYATVWAGLNASALLTGQELDLSFQDVIEFVDDKVGSGETELFKAINDSVAATQAYKKLVGEEKKTQATPLVLSE